MNRNWTQKIFTSEGFPKTNILGDFRALDVGCGQRKLPGSVGMDILASSQADIVHDMNSVPWPVDASSFDLVFINNVLEHSRDVIQIIEETHRVLKPGGRVVIQVPYFRSLDAFTDPTHTHFFTAHSLNYFIAGEKLATYRYSKALFKKVGFWYAWPHESQSPLKRLFKEFIHSHPAFYDQYLSLAVPVECLTWELEKVLK